MNEEDLIFLQYQVSTEALLRENDIFCVYEICVGRVLLELQDNKIEFLEYGGSFFEDAFRKCIDEAAAFIGCLKMGAFPASFHHFRALIELYATVSFCILDEGSSAEMLARYERYAELELSRMARALEKGEGCWDFSEDQRKVLRESYLIPSKEALKIFGCKTMEEYENKRENRKSKSWMGGRTMDQLLSTLHESHSKNYEKACNFTHFSALIKGSNSQSWGLPSWWEQVLVSAAKYTFDVYAYLREIECLSKSSIEMLDSILFKLAPLLNAKIVKVHATAPCPPKSAKKLCALIEALADYHERKLNS